MVVIILWGATASAQSVFDASLKVQTYFSGLQSPTGVAFLNDFGDALVTQKNDGRVILFRNRQRVGTALDLPVANSSERGLLSIALSPSFANDNLVYLYHSAAAADGGAAIVNKVSRYRLDGNSLVFDRKIIDLPGGPGPNHDGGKILFDSKGKLFVVIGDLNRNERTQNFQNSTSLTASGVILRLNSNGTPVSSNPYFNGARPISDIYAHGIRNSFGIAIDPATGVLWDTENGPDEFDEINRVSPGFNSGWQDVMGPTSAHPSFDPDGLESLGPRAAYSEPKLSWENPVAPTDLHFYEGSRLGAEYRNDLFVGDVKTGSIYHFDLTTGRKSLRLTGPLTDYVVNNDGDLLDESGTIRFGEGFGVTSDILTGPGGMFVLSLDQGKLYRITQATAGASVMAMSFAGVTFIPEPSLGLTALAGLAMLSARRRRGRCAYPRR
jgi:glucose/arabinose dehydrogenase